MAKRDAKPQQVELEEESQEFSEGEPEVESEAVEKGLNKSQAARAAIDAGYVKPGEAVAYIKSQFGIDMNPQHFSAIKSNYKKAQGGGRSARKSSEPAMPGRKPKGAAGPDFEGHVGQPRRQSAGGGPDLLEAMEALKPLVASLGSERLKRIVDLLG